MSGLADRLVVFTGPTLSADDARRVLDATYLPPVSQGDVYRAARERPLAIGIVDGFFERVPAVWHKEILWAMDAGVHVFGAASMGALRAAELADLGMHGVGQIFEWFRRGELEDDDEVTVVHAPELLGYQPMSDALVNIRATLARAEADGVLSPATRDTLVQLAKDTFYPHRRWARLLGDAAACGLAPTELSALTAWLPTNAIDQKRVDALQMLEAMAALARDPAPLEVQFQFQHTDAWDQVRRQIDRGSLHGGAGAETRQHDALLDELRLDPPAYREASREALVRALALDMAEGEASGVSDELLTATVNAFRVDRGLHSVSDMQAWLEREAMTVEEFGRLIEDEAKLSQVRAVYESDLDGHLADHLRLSGKHSALAARMQRKHSRLAGQGLGNPTLSVAGLADEDALWRWWFVEQLAQPIPSDIDETARGLGFRDADSLRRVVLREYLFVRLVEDDAPALPADAPAQTPRP